MNGVSHHVVPDDLAGVSAVLRWLSFTPLLVGDAPPLLPSADPVDRSIAYSPNAGTVLCGGGGIGCKCAKAGHCISQLACLPLKHAE